MIHRPNTISTDCLCINLFILLAQTHDNGHPILLLFNIYRRKISWTVIFHGFSFDVCRIVFADPSISWSAAEVRGVLFVLVEFCITMYFECLHMLNTYVTWVFSSDLSFPFPLARWKSQQNPLQFYTHLLQSYLLQHLLLYLWQHLLYHLKFTIFPHTQLLQGCVVVLQDTSY